MKPLKEKKPQNFDPREIVFFYCECYQMLNRLKFDTCLASYTHSIQSKNYLYPPCYPIILSFIHGFIVFILINNYLFWIEISFLNSQPCCILDIQLKSLEDNLAETLSSCEYVDRAIENATSTQLLLVRKQVTKHNVYSKF